MIAAAQAGADVVHGALDSMSGTTSQPSLGALVAAISQIETSTPRRAGIEQPVADLSLDQLQPLNDYWAVVRQHYAAFEQTLPSGSVDVFTHQMPGGELPNIGGGVWIRHSCITV